MSIRSAIAVLSIHRDLGRAGADTRVHQCSCGALDTNLPAHQAEHLQAAGVLRDDAGRSAGPAPRECVTPRTQPTCTTHSTTDHRTDLGGEAP